jgi:hypothetical protein
MNWGKRNLAIGVLTLAFGLAAYAAAQDDAFLQRYDLAIENLQVAVQSVPADNAQARDELDRAVNALLTLSRDTTSATLVSAMERLFDRARTAVENQSATDLAVQTAVLAGGFRRLVYDSALQAAANGDTDTARARLRHIGQGMELPQTSLDALAQADTVGALQLRIEEGVAQLIANRLDVADKLLTSDRDAAYRTVARAYGDSLLIQDSPRLAADFNQSFVSAAQAIVDQDDTAFQQAARALGAQAGRLAEADRQALITGTTEGATGAGAAPAELPSVTPQTPAATTPAANTSDAGSATPEGAAAAGSAATPSEGSAQAAAPAAGDTVDLEALRAQLEQEQDQQRHDAVLAEINAAGLTGPAAGRLADTLVTDGQTSLRQATDALYADTSRATAALLAGDAGVARTLLSDAGERYRRTLSPVVAARDPGLDADTRELLARSSTLVGLRTQDVQTVTGQVDAVSRSLEARPAPPTQDFTRTIDRWWAGWPRLIVLLLFGVLAFVPLYLLNLAFGGGNRNWQLIGVALLLLLLPVVYEALAALGSLLAYLTATPGLDLLARYSMFDSPIGQVAWALLIVLAILFAISGLYGICQQFGLLRRRGGSAGPGQTATASATRTQEQTDSMVDWDEEF